MLDINLILANNILEVLKKQGKKQVELAEHIGISRQTMSKMLGGGRLINAMELRKIAEYLNVPMDTLTRIPENVTDNNGIHVFMGRVEFSEAKEALEVADRMSDLILFHRKVKENGAAMMKPWGDA